MDASGSMLKTIVWRVRRILDEPAEDAKWSDADMIRNLIPPAVAEVMNLVSMDSRNPILVRYPVTLVEKQEYYTLPPNVGQVIRITEQDENDLIIRELMPRHELSPAGPVWAVEGQSLRFYPPPRNLPAEGLTLTVWFIPTASFSLHAALGAPDPPDTTQSGFIRLDSQNRPRVVELCATPSLGDHERRNNGLVGTSVRILGIRSGTPRPIEEHVVLGYTPPQGSTPGRVTLRQDVADYQVNDEVLYEIVPMPLHTGLVQAIALRCAITLAIYKKASTAWIQHLTALYGGTLKSFRDVVASAQSRNPKVAATPDTVDMFMGGC